MSNHPEVKQLLSDYLSNVLLHKPDDVFKYTKEYYAILADKPHHDKFLVLVGPTSVGKTVLIKKLMEDFPDTFVFPTYHTTNKEDANTGKFYFVEKENFLDVNFFFMFLDDKFK